jgi:hypothetical protein
VNNWRNIGGEAFILYRGERLIPTGESIGSDTGSKDAETGGRYIKNQLTLDLRSAQMLKVKFVKSGKVGQFSKSRKYGLSQ